MADRKMLVTQALDERDFLVKKIDDKIEKAHFVDTIKQNGNKVYGGKITKEAFENKASAEYQQIIDLIKRFQRIDAAIIESNAKTMVETTYGTMSVASAISLRNRISGKGIFLGRADFEGLLLNKMEREYMQHTHICDDKNKKLFELAEEMRLCVLDNESKGVDDNPLTVVEAYVLENTTELSDPLNVMERIEKLREKRTTLLTELTTQIKISNATTYIEI